MNKMMLLAVLACLVSPLSVRAEGTEKTGACKAEMEKFCKGVEPGEGRIVKCMKEHEAELSEGCKKMGAKMGERKEAAEACKADKEKFCKDVKPGEGRIVKCMKEHEAELSEGCKKVSAKMHEKMGEMKETSEACKADKEKFCKDVEPGEGRIIKCMKGHEAELSEGCKKASEKMHKHEDKGGKEEKKMGEHKKEKKG